MYCVVLNIYNIKKSFENIYEVQKKKKYPRKILLSEPQSIFQKKPHKKI